MDELPSVKFQTFTDAISRGVEFVLGAGAYGAVKLPKKSIVVLSLCAFGATMQVNGIYQNRHDLMRVINSIALYGLFIQLFARLLSRINGNEGKYYPVISTVRQFILNEEKNHAHRAILNASLDRQLFSVKCYVTLTVILFHIPAIMGFVLSAIRREFILSFEIYLPLTDPKTILGFSLGMIMILIFSTLFCSLILMTDVQITFFSLMLVPMADIFVLKVEKFGQRLSDFHEAKSNDNDNVPGPSTITRKQRELMHIMADRKRAKMLESIESELITLIKEYEAYNDCIGRLRLLISFTFFSVIYTSAFSIGLSLIYTRSVSSVIGIPMVVVLSFEVFMPCALGTIIATQNERLLRAFCDFPWFLLSLKKQKIFLQFLHQLQTTNEFDFTVIGVVNMRLFTDMLNACYTFVMYLLRFF